MSRRPWVVRTSRVGSTHGPEFLSGEAQLAKYRTHLDWLERIALSPDASRDFILDIAKSLCGDVRWTASPGRIPSAAREPAASASAPTPRATPTSP
ncbi:hypothetical protein [Streptomyces sp. NPDC017202]|uniref:hypothetical protein n=1 Tax=Streptomyces sp. NPDC017202 TaxID=3364981 RepID=UPI00378BC25F